MKYDEVTTAVDAMLARELAERSLVRLMLIAGPGLIVPVLIGSFFYSGTGIGVGFLIWLFVLGIFILLGPYHAAVAILGPWGRDSKPKFAMLYCVLVGLYAVVACLCVVLVAGLVLFVAQSFY